MGAVILLIVFVFPMISGVIGAADYFIWKKVWIGTLIVLIASLILLFTLASGNSSFMFWVVLYTAIALAASVVTLFLRKLLFN
ncbi:hypothetical protein BSF_39980 [Bacillus subtilis]|uniref:DUF2651 family protein n=1 Tax=Bacillus halotolerans TaxID=260554 RepID=UPI0007518FC0|nr:DUF2651 family protein [Bacillus halotolerans]KUP36667.1 hypothetical protein AU387_06730 [Bacillus halotolerans]BDG82269.1 hypothetical protein BSF_39980 [Bacillus subtilis]